MSTFSALYAICTLYLLPTVFGVIERDYIIAMHVWQKERHWTWSEANDFCKNTYDSYLASMISFRDFELAYNYSYFGGFIGLNDVDEDDQWSWIDGSSCQVQEPNNSDICTDFYQQNPNFENATYCSYIPWGARLVTDYDCDIAYTQLFCNKVRGYIAVPSTKNQSAAEQYCQSQYGTHLATIQPYDLRNAQRAISTDFSFIDHWVGLIPANIKSNNIWLDGTDYNVGNDLVKLNNASICRSFHPNDGIIDDSNSCSRTLPFLCNKRMKPREYIIHKRLTSFDDAQQFCQDTYGTDLATVITEEEYSDVLRMIPQFEAAWVGLRNISNKYVWLDGTNCTEEDVCVPYWNTYAPEPVHECGWIWKNGVARTMPCDQTMENFVCNKPDILPTTIPTTIPTTMPTIMQPTSSEEMWMFQAGIGGFTHIIDGDINIDIPVDGVVIFGRSPNIDERPIQTVYWYLYQNVKGIDNMTWSDMYKLYEDIDELNDEIKMNANDSNGNVSVVGNVILCTDDLCELSDKIGPSSSPLQQYFPIKINTDFNVDNIVIVRDQQFNDDKLGNIIKIWGYFYSIYSNDRARDKIQDAIQQKVFPNGLFNTFDRTVGTNIIGEWGVFVVTYYDLESVYQDVGNPYDWKELFTDYYFEPDLNDLVIYMYGITAACINNSVYDAFLMYKGNVSTTTTELLPSMSTTTVMVSGGAMVPSTETDVYMIIAIVFIILFAISVGVIIFLCWKRNEERHSAQGRGGYLPATSIANDEVELNNTAPTFDV